MTQTLIETTYTGDQLLHLAITANAEEFQALSIANQALVVATTKKMLDKLKRLDTGRRGLLAKTIPDEGVVGKDFSVRWQPKPGRWVVDEDELAKLYPEKVVKVTTQHLDPVFVEDYLARAKKTKPGAPLPPGISYVCGEGRQLVVRTK